MVSLMASFSAVLFPTRLSWMRSGTLLSQFLRDFLPTLALLGAIFSSMSRPPPLEGQRRTGRTGKQTVNYKYNRTSMARAGPRSAIGRAPDS